MLPAPAFHHLHLNSVDPDAAIDFYVRQFPRSSKTRWGGLPALAAPNDVLVLFSKVATAPATSPQTAIWHFGWHVADTRASLESYQGRTDVTLLPLYTTDEGGSVWISSDTWPGTGGVPGRTKTQIAEARANGVPPTRTGGFGYLQGPDNALVEYAGNYPTERFNHVHLFQDEPFCAQLWYETHLNAPVFAGRGRDAPLTEATCTVPRGQLYDHIALRVTDLDAWVAKLRSEGVTFLEEPCELGDARAVMIEGPSREALELVEIA